MMIPLEVLEAEVLNLPSASRAVLIERLMSSLNRDPEWEAAWAAESDRRELAIANGQSEWVTSDELHRQLNAVLS